MEWFSFKISWSPCPQKKLIRLGPHLGLEGLRIARGWRWKMSPWIQPGRICPWVKRQLRLEEMLKIRRTKHFCRRKNHSHMWMLKIISSYLNQWCKRNNYPLHNWWKENNKWLNFPSFVNKNVYCVMNFQNNKKLWPCEISSGLLYQLLHMYYGWLHYSQNWVSLLQL